MRPMLCVLLAACLATIASDARAVIIFSNAITGADPGQISPYTTGQSFASNLTVSGIGRGTGITGSNGDNRYNARGWDTTAIDLNAYFTFTLTPDAGFLLNLNRFTYTGERSGSGPTISSVRTSVDNFADNVESPDVISGSPTSFTINFVGTQYQNITLPTELRLFAWGTTTNAGTFSVNDFAFDGTVTAVPEPTSLAVAAIGCIGGIVVRYRRRKAISQVNPLVI